MPAVRLLRYVQRLLHGFTSRSALIDGATMTGRQNGKTEIVRHVRQRTGLATGLPLCCGDIPSQKTTARQAGLTASLTPPAAGS